MSSKKFKLDDKKDKKWVYVDLQNELFGKGIMKDRTYCVNEKWAEAASILTNKYGDDVYKIVKFYTKYAENKKMFYWFMKYTKECTIDGELDIGNQTFKVVDTPCESAAVDGIGPVVVVHKPGDQTRNTNKITQPFSKFIELFLEWCIFFIFSCFFDLLLNSADGGFHTGESYNTRSTTIVNNRRCENHISLIL